MVVNTQVVAINIHYLTIAEELFCTGVWFMHNGVYMQEYTGMTLILWCILCVLCE